MVLSRKLRKLAGQVNQQIPDRPLRTLEQAITRIKAKKIHSIDSLELDALELDGHSG